MDIPVFVSCPTSLSPQQENARSTILRYLSRYSLEPRALGRSDYPTELPLREVLVIAKHCAGGIILGFEQYRSLDGIDKGHRREPCTVPSRGPAGHLHHARRPARQPSRPSHVWLTARFFSHV
jgi:hypothetical protein